MGIFDFFKKNKNIENKDSDDIALLILKEVKECPRRPVLNNNNAMCVLQ